MGTKKKFYDTDYFIYTHFEVNLASMSCTNKICYMASIHFNFLLSPWTYLSVCHCRTVAPVPFLHVHQHSTVSPSTSIQYCMSQYIKYLYLIIQYILTLQWPITDKTVKFHCNHWSIL